MAKQTKPTSEEEKKIRFTLFAKPSTIAKLDHISRAESLANNRDISRSDMVNAAFDEFITKWEKKNGEIKLK